MLQTFTEQSVRVETGSASLEGNLSLSQHAVGLVVFAHGSGSSRLSPRNRFVARALEQAGLATLLFDLLTPGEEAIDAQTMRLRFNIGLLAERLIGGIRWLKSQPPTQHLRIGAFGASTGAAAALIAAARLPERVAAVVSRGGRPDLAGPNLPRVAAPTLLIVGARDPVVLDLNKQALARLGARTKQLTIVPGATHLFEEPGALEAVARLASSWFSQHLGLSAT